MIAVLYALLGALIGLGVAVVLYALGFWVECLNCTCQWCLSCESDVPELFPGLTDGSYLSIVIFCVICGAIIGLVYGLYKLKVKHDEKEFNAQQKISELEEEQEKEFASIIRREISGVELNRVSVASKQNKAIIDAQYDAEKSMSEIVKKFDSIVEVQGNIDAIASNYMEEED